MRYHAGLYEDEDLASDEEAEESASPSPTPAPPVKDMTAEEQQRVLQAASRTLQEVMRSYTKTVAGVVTSTSTTAAEAAGGALFPTGVQSSKEHPAVSLIAVQPVKGGRKTERQTRIASAVLAEARRKESVRQKELLERFDKTVQGKKLNTDTEDSADPSYTTGNVSDRRVLRSGVPLASARSEPILREQQKTVLMQLYDCFSTHEHA